MESSASKAGSFRGKTSPARFECGQVKERESFPSFWPVQIVGMFASAFRFVSVSIFVYCWLTSTLLCPTMSITTVLETPAFFIMLTALCRKEWKLNSFTTRRLLVRPSIFA
jgi:hypothetical protein